MIIAPTALPTIYEPMKNVQNTEKYKPTELTEEHKVMNSP